MEAISKINDCIFVIIGDGEERKNIESMISELGLSNKVFLAGRIEMASLYLKAFDIFTLTSISEALPYALVEAGNAELAIVASEVGGIPEIIEDKKSGLLVTPRDTEEIKSDIESLLNNPEKIRNLGKNLKEKIEKEFGFEKMISKTLDLYKKS
jgi:glycosyltransferase involved in cell wall biosynthesis